MRSLASIRSGSISIKKCIKIDSGKALNLRTGTKKIQRLEQFHCLLDMAYAAAHLHQGIQERFSVLFVQPSGFQNLETEQLVPMNWNIHADENSPILIICNPCRIFDCLALQTN